MSQSTARNPKANTRARPAASLVLTVIGVLLAASSLLGLYLGIFSAGTLVWPMLLFEPIVLGCGIAVVCVGLGVQRTDAAMALATSAGCLAVAGFLSTVAGRNTLGGGLLVPLLGVRLLMAAIISVWAAWLVLGPNAVAWRRVILGCLLLLGGMGLASLAFIGPAQPLRGWLVSQGGFIASAAALTGFIVLVILVSAGLQMVVRPFERALDARRSPGQPAA